MSLRYGEIDQNINELTCPKTYVMVCGSFTQRGYGGVPTTWKARIAFTRYQDKFAFNHQLNQLSHQLDKQFHVQWPALLLSLGSNAYIQPFKGSDTYALFKYARAL